MLASAWQRRVTVHDRPPSPLGRWLFEPTLADGAGYWGCQLSATRAWIQGGAVRGTVEISGASARSGALAALGCYLLWGLVPLYWKRLAAIDSLELIAHRHLWSLALLALLMMVRGEGWSSAVAALSTVRGAARLVLASLLLTTNWLVYVWGVNTGHIVETSLGYFLVPLFSVLAGRFLLHEQLRRFFDGFRRDAHPMAVMCGVVGALAAFYHDNLDINDARQREIAAFRLIAKVPTIAAWAYKYSIGQPFMYPRNDLSYAENFLYMLNAVPAEPWVPNPILSRAMDRILILHADHEQNASTSTVRLAGSTGANPFACIAAGIAALWGPAHGGANEAVLKMLEEIGSADKVGSFIEHVKRKERVLMGFGHRVYKNYDPRAKIVKKISDEVFEIVGREPLVDIAMELERIALTDEYFI